MQKRIYTYNRRFVWANIAQEYVNLFNRVIKMDSVFGAAPDVSTSECVIDQIEVKRFRLPSTPGKHQEGLFFLFI